MFIGTGLLFYCCLKQFGRRMESWYLTLCPQSYQRPNFMFILMEIGLKAVISQNLHYSFINVHQLVKLRHLQEKSGTN